MRQRLALQALNPRQRALTMALVLTLLACVVLALGDDPPPDGGALARVPATPLRPPSAAAAGVDRLSAAEPARGPWPEVSRQALLAWAPKPEPAAPVAPRPAPSSRTVTTPPPPAIEASAPPVPYRYTGRLTQDGHLRALLIGPLGTVVVSEREALAGQWRVDRIADDALWLTWLPGSLPQRLPFATASS